MALAPGPEERFPQRPLRSPGTIQIPEPRTEVLAKRMTKAARGEWARRTVRLEAAPAREREPRRGEQTTIAPHGKICHLPPPEAKMLLRAMIQANDSPAPTCFLRAARKIPRAASWVGASRESAARVGCRIPVFVKGSSWSLPVSLLNARRRGNNPALQHGNKTNRIQGKKLP